MSYSIYWIRYDHHSDPLTEGYIGVSKYPDRRMKYHGDPKSQNNEILYRALSKGAQQEVLFTYDIKEDAYAKEVEMRPTAKIGWNIIPGGDSTPPVQWGNTFYRFKGKQPRVSCIECRFETTWHKITAHLCRPVCAHEGCDNRVKKVHRKYCSRSCSMRNPSEAQREQARINGRKNKGKQQ